MPGCHSSISKAELSQRKTIFEPEVVPESARRSSVPVSPRCSASKTSPSANYERADQQTGFYTPTKTSLEDDATWMNRSANRNSYTGSSPLRAQPATGIATSGTDELSVASQPISEHYSVRHPELAGVKGHVWSERYHAHGLRRALKDPNAEWVERSIPSNIRCHSV
jgi:hypothetical protein